LLEGLFGSRCKSACGSCETGCDVGCGCGGTTAPAPKTDAAPAKAPGNEPAPLPNPPTTNKDASVSNQGGIIQASRNIVRN
jgi:hypothetical protein